MSTQQSLPRRIRAKDLAGMSGPVKQLVLQGKIFAVHHLQGTSRLARITISGDKLYLHHLREGQPPPDSHVIEYTDILTLVDPSSRVTFLDLGSAGSTLGQMIFRLTPDTKGAQNFALLCSGEMGPCYANTKLFEVRHRGSKWEYVGGGDYELNNGDGGKAVVEGLELGPEYERPWVAGIVRGFWGLGNNVSAQFFIGTRDHPIGVCSPAFGVVEEGLNILNQAVRRYVNINDVNIQDCGLILNSSVPC